MHGVCQSGACLHLPLLCFGGAGRAQFAGRVGRPPLLDGGGGGDVVGLNQRQQLVKYKSNSCAEEHKIKRKGHEQHHHELSKVVQQGTAFESSQLTAISKRKQIHT